MEKLPTIDCSLESIGFYTLSDARVKVSVENPTTANLSRCEILLTGRCNFQCPYCRRVGGPDLAYDEVARIVKLWASQGLKAIRFSGGEPLLWRDLPKIVEYTKSLGVERIAVSSNGSLAFAKYTNLLDLGVNDLSISLDACCAEDGDKMAGGVKGAWERVVANIKKLSPLCYLTVGVVLTEDNADRVNDIVQFADSLGVSDIRVIPAAQCGDRLKDIVVDEHLLNKYPILKYRINNLRRSYPVRGLGEHDSNRCGLVCDDMAVCEDKHYPCIIYLREGGDAIGVVSDKMREERYQWYLKHNVKSDPICSKNCLDVCAQYNRLHSAIHGSLKGE